MGGCLFQGTGRCGIWMVNGACLVAVYACHSICIIHYKDVDYYSKTVLSRLLTFTFTNMFYKYFYIRKVCLHLSKLSFTYGTAGGQKLHFLLSFLPGLTQHHINFLHYF